MSGASFEEEVVSSNPSGAGCECVSWPMIAAAAGGLMGGRCEVEPG